jgi:hypothetical protein
LQIGQTLLFTSISIAQEGHSLVFISQDNTASPIFDLNCQEHFTPFVGYRSNKTKHNDMSQAFVREGDNEWLSDVGPSLRALIVFLTRENNGIAVYEKRKFTDSNGKEFHVMSNGLSYSKDEQGKWETSLTPGL